jgi:hypothetical protein
MLRLALPLKFAGFEKDPLLTGRLCKESFYGSRLQTVPYNSTFGALNKDQTLDVCQG